MQILPLKFIHDDDKKLVGLNLFNLAKLKHHGIPVVESVVVIPPTQSIQKLMEKYQGTMKIVLEEIPGVSTTEILSQGEPHA